MSMTGVTVIDRDEASGAHAAQRLESDRIAWMTTIRSNGTPQVSPIWFIWDGEEFLIYSRETARVDNLADQPRVSLNLDGDGQGGDIVVIEGTARIDRSLPSAADNAVYLTKYQPVMDDYGWTAQWFAEQYSAPIRVTPTKYRYW